MEKVSLKRCDSYDLDKLYALFIDAFRDIGFDVGAFRGKRVAIKPNIMIPFPVDRGVVTHPVFVKAIAKLIVDNGGRVVLTECPGISHPPKAAEKIGYAAFAKELGMEIPGMESILNIRYNGAKRFKTFEVAAEFADADIIVSLPKLKTHGFMYMTGAVKNLLGTIPGLRKAQMHMRAPDKADFGDLLIDLNLALIHGFEKKKTILHLMDAVVGQEGEGPGPAGVPRKIGAVIAGRDPVAVDWVAAQILGFDVSKIPTMTAGFARKEFVSGPDEIEVVGEKIGDLKLEKFKPTRSSLPSHIYRGFLVGPRARNLFMERPEPSPDKCSLCYQCKSICPAGVISKADEGGKTPKFDYKKCIRCFCCTEVCPEAAIGRRKGRFQWMVKIRL